MEAMATKFLKKWIGLARSTDTSRLYLPKSEGGLELPAISTLYKKQQATIAGLLLTSPDPVGSTHCHTSHQERGKLSRSAHTPMLEAREVWQTDPGAGRKTLLKKVKGQVMVDDRERRLDHAKSLKHQGQLFQY